MNDIDVIVVGAGVAGLSAAAELRRQGRGCVVLEAASRIGGRAFTAEVAGVPFDHGASWLHQAERNALADIARDHGDPLRDADSMRVRRMQIGTRVAGSAELAGWVQAQDRFYEQAGARAVQEPDISFSEAIRPMRTNPWAATLTTWEATLIAAADPDDFSLRDWHLNELDGANLAVAGGVGALVARRLGPPAGDVRLDTEVSRIGWSADGVVVQTASGALRARAAIVTVSTGVLAAGAITFDPGLPDNIAAAVAGLPMGLLTKVLLPALGDDRLGLADTTSLQQRVSTGAPAMFFNAWPDGRPHVIGFVGGPTAWGLSRDGDAATEEFARAQLRGMLGTRADGHLGPAVVTQWGTDPLHRGAYCYARVGQAGARAALGTPLAGGRLIFAGEATCTDGLAGTVGGAWLEGRRAARNIAKMAA